MPPDTETPTDGLPIPDAAWDAAGRAVTDFANENGIPPAGRGAVALIVHAAAPHIVAAELRRMADTAPPADAYGLDEEDIAHDDGVREMAARLRARADQLDSAGG